MTETACYAILETADDVLVDLFAGTDVDEEKAILHTLFEKVFDHGIGFARTRVSRQEERRDRLVAKCFDDQAIVRLAKRQRFIGTGNMELLQFEGRECTRCATECGEVLLVEMRDNKRNLVRGRACLSPCYLLLNG